MTARFFHRVWVLAIALFLGACATPPRYVPQMVARPDHWEGRLSVRVDSDPVQSFSAGFELEGNARSGRLSLYSPLGGTVAQLTWSPAEARLRSDGRDQTFGSLDALTRHAVGTALPIASIFSWLDGQSAHTDGWVADLQNHAGGRLVARRLEPAPAVEMRMVIDLKAP